MNNTIRNFIIELWHIRGLHKLSLTKNPIEIFHEGTFKIFLITKSKQLKKLSFDTNNIICDCNIDWVLKIKKIIIQKINIIILTKTYTNNTKFIEYYKQLSLNVCEKDKHTDPVTGYIINNYLYTHIHNIELISDIYIYYLE